MRPWPLVWIPSLALLTSAFADGRELVPFTCMVDLVDRQTLSWVGGGQGRTSRAASAEALRSTCDDLPHEERTVCRQQAPLGKWVETISKGSDPARPGRTAYYHHVRVEIFKPRSLIHAVGRTVGFLTASPPLEKTEDYARACHRAIDQACRLLGAEVTAGFHGS